MKRDDQTGLAFGGNKTRKLEFLIAEAQEKGARTLITGGALQSNHCRQTAAAAARFGFKCILILTGDQPEQPSANLLLDQLFGAQIIYVSDRKDRDRVLQENFDRALKDGLCPYLVPYGGSSPTGALGYAFAVQELMAQKVDADWIVFATSSVEPKPGLFWGSACLVTRAKSWGLVSMNQKNGCGDHVSELASVGSERLGERIEFSAAEVLVNDDYCKSGYGVLTEAEQEAIHLFAKHEGVLLDPVYTGRAAAGMIDLIRKGFFQKNEIVLFLHTGGQPALFADKLPERRADGALICSGRYVEACPFGLIRLQTDIYL